MTVTPADARLDGKVAVVTGAAQGIGEADRAGAGRLRGRRRRL